MSDDKKLSPKHVEFVRQYLLLGRNATEAYRRVYPKNKNPNVDSAVLLAKPSIQEEIRRREQRIEEKFQITEDRIIQELAAVAFGHAGKVMEWDSSSMSFIPKEKLSDDDMKFVESIQETPTEHGTAIRMTTLAGHKIKALELLGKHRGMFKDGRSTGNQPDRAAQLSRVSELLRKRNKTG